MITLYFVRHGETTWNLTGKYQGRTDVGLSEKGVRQAELAAAWFDREKIDGIVTSPLIRARVTAEKIAERRGTDVELVPEFSEISFGVWEGLTFDEIDARWPGAVATMYTAPDTLRIEGGETFEEVEARTMEGIRKLIARGDGKTWIIVSHGAAIRTMLCGLLGLPLRFSWQLSQSNANISCIHYYGEGQSWLYLLNSQEHLAPLGSPKFMKDLPKPAK